MYGHWVNGYYRVLINGQWFTFCSWDEYIETMKEE